jgi:Holliday junction resolvase-like predicted endonuclease
MKLKQTRAPKQIGDFGEGLVTYALIRKGYEVAYVDHVGADLIAEKEGNRIAISVKTRLFKHGSTESKMFCIEHSHLEKLETFSEQFALQPVFALVVCLADNREIHLITLKTTDIPTVFHEIQHGFSVLFSEKHLLHIKENPLVDYSFWGSEEIGKKDFV